MLFQLLGSERAPLLETYYDLLCIVKSEIRVMAQYDLHGI